jgi:hypothetical protein
MNIENLILTLQPAVRATDREVNIERSKELAHNVT